MAEWYANIESKVFTIVKTRTTKKYKTKYPSLEFITDDENKTPTNSPTVYLREIDSPEMANSLEGNYVNMVREHIEVEVYSRKSKAECKDVSVAVRAEMKALCFSITEQSPPIPDGDWWRCVMRFYRPIGAGDVLK